MDWNQHYYESYWKRCHSPKSFYPEYVLAYCLKQLEPGTGSRTINVLDIGAGDWEKATYHCFNNHAAEARLNNTLQQALELAFTDSEYAMPSLDLDIKVVCLDPYFTTPENKYQLSNKIKIEFKCDKRTFGEFLASYTEGQDTKFDIIISIHGLYGHLETTKNFASQDTGHQTINKLSGELRKIAQKEAVFCFIHSSYHSPEKQLRFDPSEKTFHKDYDRYFQFTDAESIYDRLRKDFFACSRIEYGKLIFPKGMIDKDNNDFLRFVKYFFRIAQNNNSDVIRCLAGRLSEKYKEFEKRLEPYTSEVEIPYICRQLTFFTNGVHAFRRSSQTKDILSDSQIPASAPPDETNKILRCAAKKLSSGLPDVYIYFSRTRREFDAQKTGGENWIDTRIFRPAEKKKRENENYALVMGVPLLYQPTCIAGGDEYKSKYPLFANPERINKEISARPILICCETVPWECPGVSEIRFPSDWIENTDDMRQELTQTDKIALKEMWGGDSLNPTSQDESLPPVFLKNFPDMLNDGHTDWGQTLYNLHELFWNRYNQKRDDTNFKNALIQIFKSYLIAVGGDTELSEKIFGYALFLRAQCFHKDFLQLLIPTWSHIHKKLTSLTTLILDVNQAGEITTLLELHYSLSKVVEAGLSALQLYDKTIKERKAAIKAQTAAIMSRNMSHNLGSHALANSKFFESVGILNQTGRANEVLQFSKGEIEEARGRLQAFNQYCQGRLDFIARMLSEGGDKPDPMFLANDVLKGFMAQQVLLDTLLDDNGFRTKNIALHLHDLDKETHDVCKYVPASGKSHYELKSFYRFDQEDTGAKENVSPSVEDVLVGITGGMTGCHALYAFIENLLRNAAKYSGRQWGPGETPQLEFHIELSGKEINIKDKETDREEKKECYLLRFWENLTNDTDNVATSKVRDGLSQDVIDKEGKPIQGGHGVQEMRLCAKYLAGDDLAFPNDSILLENSIADDPTDAKYIAYLKEVSAPPDGERHSGEKAFVALTSPKLRAYHTDKEGRQALVYEMLLPKPILLGMTCVRCGGFGDKDNTGGLHPCDNLQHPGDSAYFGLIIAHDAKSETMEFTLKEIAEHHTLLPYRLLIVTGSETEKKDWDTAIAAASANPTKNPKRFFPADSDAFRTAKENFKINDENCAPILPFRRVHVITEPGFFKTADGQTGAASSDTCTDSCARLKNLSKEDWQNLILTVYEKWIWVWKGDPPGKNEPWKLLIGFQRDAGQIETRWKAQLEEFKKAESLVDVYVAANPDGKTDKLLISRENGECKTQTIIKDLPAASETCLVFDNHGEVFSGTGYQKHSDVRFYHKFSGSEMSLYQMLESPPSKGFPFDFFMLSLLEGCLTNIVTLDERVADATIKDGSLNGEFLNQIRRAGIHPLYSFDDIKISNEQPQDDDFEGWKALISRRFITPNIYKWLEENLNLKSKLAKIPGHLSSKRRKEDEAEIQKDFSRAITKINREGIRFSGKQEIELLHEFGLDSTESVLPLGADKTGKNTPDLIIIHEGITDEMHNRTESLWKEGDHYRLYSLLPAVIRTSGRGRKSRHLGDALPFIELNVLSDSCYGSLNKIKLARAVLNATGEYRKTGEPS